MNSVGFLQLPSRMKYMDMEPIEWDRQTLAILFYSNNVGNYAKDDIRSRYKPTSHSEGNGYEIDVYTNLNYSKFERDHAMRNIRVVYCDMNILSDQSVNNRFPNAYIVRVKERSEEVDTQRISREIPQISGT